MKHVKSLLALVLTLMLVCGMAVVPAAAAEGTLVGDAKLFLPSIGAIKVQYTLTSDGTTAVADAAYSIAKVENADDSEIAAADIFKYAQIDAATGDLYVSQAAKGKEIFVSATGTGYSASNSVVVSEVSYGTNFEDGVIPSFITNGDNVSVATDVNGNQYAPLLSAKWGDTNATVIDLSTANFATNHLTIEMKFKSTGESNRNANADTGVVASYWNPTYPLQVVYDQTFVGRQSYSNAKDTTYTVTAKWSTGKTATANTSKVYFTDYYPGTASATNNGIYEASAKEVLSYTYTGSYTANSGAGRDGGFSDDFDFISLKAQIIGDQGYTTVNGVGGTTKNFVNHISGVSVKDANITKIILGSPIDDLEIYTGERTSDEIFASHSIEGDSLALLPLEGGVKLFAPYVMKTRDGATVANATFSIAGVTTATGEKVLEDNFYQYAQIDEAGYLSVGPKAKGGKVRVAATTDGVTVEKEVNVVCYSTDFEDEGALGSTVSNPIFSTKTATIVNGATGKGAESSVVSVDNLSTYGLVINPSNLNVNKYVITANVAVKNSSSSGSHLGIKYSGAPGVTKIYSEKNNGGPDKLNLSYKGNATSWGNDARGSDFDYTWGTYLPFKVVVNNNWKFASYLANQNRDPGYLYGHNSSSTEALYTDGVEAIAFGSMVDDIEILNGEKISDDIFATHKIVGDKLILLPSDGIIKVTGYEMQDLDGTAMEDVTYALSGAGVNEYASVNPVTGDLYIKAGEAYLGKTFTMTATSGADVAKATIAISDTYYGATFDDGRIPSFISGASNLTVQTDALGNKYAPFKANTDWNALAGSKIDFSGIDFAPNALTVEAKFKSAGYADLGTATDPTNYPNGSYNNPNRPFQLSYEDLTFEGYSAYNNATLRDWNIDVELRASNTGAGKAKLGVHDYRSARINDTSHWYKYAAGTEVIGNYTYNGTYTRTNGSNHAYTFSDEFDFTKVKVVVKNNKLYTTVDDGLEKEATWISDVKDSDGSSVNAVGAKVSHLMFGTPIDEFEIYSGEKVAETSGISINAVMQDGVAFAAPIAITVAEGDTERTVIASVNEATTLTRADDVTILLARYNSNNELVSLKSALVEVTDFGKVVGEVKMVANFAQGDYVKAFLWKWGTLQPVK